MVARDLALAGYEARPLHLLHLSARESVEELRRARAAGVPATAEVTPHHLCLTDDAVRSLDPNVKMNPPLRADEDRAALVDALLDGTIEAIATDHAPHAREEKEVPFEEAPFGVTGLETAFSALYTQLVEPGVVPLATLLERMSAGPARIYGLEAPTIAVGRAGQPRPPRPRRRLARGRGLLQFEVGELLAPRLEAARPGRPDGRSRKGGSLGLSGFLVLEDGSVFRGRSVGALGVAHGEAVFTTAMTGYQEIVTDPSFSEQIVAFTAPMIGNYGVSPQRSESARPHARAVLMRQATGGDWTRWLHGHGIVALEEIDTRALVVRLRERGAMRAAAVAGAASLEQVLADVRAQAPMAGRALVAGVSTPEPYRVGRGEIRVAVLDYGCKRSIVDRLNAGGVQASVFPHDTDAETILADRPAGVLALERPRRSSGARGARSGSSGSCSAASRSSASASATSCLPRRPASRPSSFRSGTAERTTPCWSWRASRVLVTSQNHGFAVRGDGPAVTHVSLYDGTVEGIALPGERARSLQFHPEAGPGPHDAWPEIEGWVEEIGYAAAA